MKKILKKRHIKSLAYNIGKFFIRKTPPPLCSAQEALAYLGSLTPDSHGSCICEHHFAEADCDVEVIVPCYNVELYLSECVESILSQQTRYSFFLTLVNDGSTDRTGEVLEQYVGRRNVRVITQEHQGVSSARNVALAQAHGRYVMFMDSDDILLPGSIESLMQMAERSGADIVDSGYERFADRKSARTLGARLRAAIFDSGQRQVVLSESDDADAAVVSGFVWGKVFRRELFQRVQFPTGYWFEDSLTWLVLLPLSSRLATVANITTRYRMQPQSITHVVKGSIKKIDATYVVLQLLDDREALGIEFDQQQYHSVLKLLRRASDHAAHFPRKVQKAAFAVASDLLKHRLGALDTSDPYMRPIQELLRSGNFAHFRLWNKWKWY